MDAAAQAHATAPPPRFTEGSLVKVRPDVTNVVACDTVFAPIMINVPLGFFIARNLSLALALNAGTPNPKPQTACAKKAGALNVGPGGARHRAAVHLCAHPAAAAGVRKLTLVNLPYCRCGVLSCACLNLS